jgi:tRNA(fMet)-specific endonuclease VapC
MSGTKYLVDTNAAIAIMKRDAVIERKLTEADELCVCTIAIGELYYGAEKSAQLQENITRLEEFLSRRTLLVCDQHTARWYGHVFFQLRSQGSPIPQNDVWIAATALQHDLTLLTRDGHFDHVAGLKKAAW